MTQATLPAERGGVAAPNGDGGARREPETPAGGADAPAWLVENIAELSRNTRTLHVIHVSFLLFCAFTIVVTPDRQIILDEAAHLPILNIDVPFGWFVIIAPLVAIGLHIYFQVYLQALIRTVNAAHRDYVRLPKDRLYPWLINMAARTETGLIGFFQRLIVNISLWGLLPLVLLCFNTFTLKKHSVSLSFFEWAISSAGIALTYTFWRHYKHHDAHTRDENEPARPGAEEEKAGGRTKAEGGKDEVKGEAARAGGDEDGPGSPAAAADEKEVSPEPDTLGLLVAAFRENLHLNLFLSLLLLTQLASLIMIARLVIDRSLPDFLNVDLRGEVLVKEQKYDIPWVKLPGAHLEWARLDDAVLERSDLKGAQLKGASLNGANLKRAILTSASLEEASLRGGKFGNATLAGATLANADLTCADLSGANFAGARLFRAILFRANLSDAKNLDYGQLSEALTLAGAVGIKQDLEVRLRETKPELFEVFTGSDVNMHLPPNPQRPPVETNALLPRFDSEARSINRTHIGTFYRVQSVGPESDDFYVREFSFSIGKYTGTLYEEPGQPRERVVVPCKVAPVTPEASPTPAGGAPAETATEGTKP